MIECNSFDRQLTNFFKNKKNEFKNFHRVDLTRKIQDHEDSEMVQITGESSVVVKTEFYAIKQDFRDILSSYNI